MIIRHRLLNVQETFQAILDSDEKSEMAGMERDEFKPDNDLDSIASVVDKTYCGPTDDQDDWFRG